jgi:uncharacterized protein (TIGR00304 family)
MLNRLTAFAAALFALGIALVALSILRGEGGAGLFVCVPFFLGTGLFASLGVLCFLGGMVMLFLGMARGAAEAVGPGGRGGPAGPEGPAGPAAGDDADAAPRTRAGGVILLGPIPLVFGSDAGISRSMFYLALGLMAGLVVALLALALI